MKRLNIITIAAIFLITGAFSYIPQKTDFSGNWKINKTRMDFGRIPEYIMPTSFVIEQHADRILVEKTSLTHDNEEIKVTENLLFDGSVTKTDLPDGRKKMSNVKWNDNGKIIVWYSENQNADGTSIGKVTDSCILIDGGKTLIIQKSVKQSDGYSFTIKGFYEKQ
jgi:hypothetical protein